jgi:hypothetical protein
VTVKNAVFWDVTQCGFVRTDVSEERIAAIIRVTRIGQLGTLAVTISLLRMLVTANVAPISPILVTLIMEPLRCSETSNLTRATRRNIREDGILLSMKRFWLNLIKTSDIYTVCVSVWRILNFALMFHTLFRINTC